MAYLAIAYPEITTKALQQIQVCRKERDQLYPVTAAHFTLVFATGYQLYSAHHYWRKRKSLYLHGTGR